MTRKASDKDEDDKDDGAEDDYDDEHEECASLPVVGKDLACRVPFAEYAAATAFLLVNQSAARAYRSAYAEQANAGWRTNLAIS